VACVTGEGSIQMCIQELSTCTHYSLPVKIINMNNGYLGMVKQWQDMQYAGRHSHSTYHGFAAGFREARRGLWPRRHARRVEGGTVVPRCEKAFVELKDRSGVHGHRGGPASEHVYPMHIAPGSLRDMMAQLKTGENLRCDRIISILLDGKRGGRPVPRDRAVLAARFQHRDAERRADRGSHAVASHADDTSGDDRVIEQITKQLNKLVDVVKLERSHRRRAHRARADADQAARDRQAQRDEIKRCADIFRGQIVDVTESTYVIELTASGAKLDSFIQAIDGGLILETVRTGVCGIGRGERILKV
jgi:acetolactate synthase-1/3 small subunit